MCVYPYMCASHVLHVYSDTCVCFTHTVYVVIHVCVHLYVCASHTLHVYSDTCVCPYMCASHALHVYSETCMLPTRYVCRGIHVCVHLCVCASICVCFTHAAGYSDTCVCVSIHVCFTHPTRVQRYVCVLYTRYVCTVIHMCVHLCVLHTCCWLQ